MVALSLGPSASQSVPSKTRRLKPVAGRWFKPDQQCGADAVAALSAFEPFEPACTGSHFGYRC
jgi:hypothetical protein